MIDDIQEIIDINAININDEKIENKEDLFRKMSTLLYKTGYIEDADNFIEALYERENSGSTYMGNGLAVPHGKSQVVNKPGICFYRVSPFIYDSDENEEVQIALMLAIPEKTGQEEYIKILANIMRLFVDESFLNLLKTSMSRDNIYNEFVKRYSNE